MWETGINLTTAFIATFSYQKEQWATSGQGYLLSRIFEPITTALRQVTMKGIACTVERVERRVSVNIADGAGVRLIKTIETWKGGNYQILLRYISFTNDGEDPE